MAARENKAAKDERNNKDEANQLWQGRIPSRRIRHFRTGVL